MNSRCGHIGFAAGLLAIVLVPLLGFAMPLRDGIKVAPADLDEMERLGVNTVSTPMRDAGLRAVINRPGDITPLVTGTKWCVVAAIRFPDYPENYPTRSFDSMLFAGPWPTGSARDYYRQVSYDQLSLNGVVVGWDTAANNRAHYGRGYGTVRAAMLAKEAAAGADAAINFATYDNDHDGYVDNFTCLHTGYGYEESGSNDDIWSHVWSFSSAAIGVYTTNDADPFNGGYIKINTYAIVPERSNYAPPPRTMSTIGVFCHEWGHLLGLPDLYDTRNLSHGLGRWCLMSNGSWGGNGTTPWLPVHLSPWCKLQLGWWNPATVRRHGFYSIPQVETNSRGYWLPSRNRTFREYFLVENRQKTRSDSLLPGSGLLIYHIDDSVVAARAPANKVNVADSTWKYGVALEQADGQEHLRIQPPGGNNGDGSDPWPGTLNITRFDSLATTPNSRTNYPLPSGLISGCQIKNISPSGPTASCTMTSGVTGGFTGGPDPLGYRWIDSDTTGGPACGWNDIGMAGSVLLGSGDDSLWRVRLPYKFSFYGTSFDTLWVSSNGWFRFGSDRPVSAAPGNTGLPSASAPTRAVFPLWDDWDLRAVDSGQVFYRNYGATPNCSTVIMWKNARRKGLNGAFNQPVNPVSFEVVLHEFGNKTLVRYRDCAVGDTNYSWGRSATVGIQNSTGAVGLQYLYNGSPVGNLISAERAIEFTRPVGPDVSATRLLAPVGNIDSGSTVTPACSLVNNGTTIATYTVRMKIGAVYNRTVMIASHMPNGRIRVTFPNWLALPRGTHAVSCSTEMVGDSTPSNDKQTGTVSVVVRDAGLAALLAPTGLIDSNHTIAPACTVQNFGYGAADVRIRMRVGSFYNQTVTAFALPTNGRRYVTFPAYAAWPRGGPYLVTCSTELAGDVNLSNDRRIVGVTVQVRDVGCRSLLAPAGIFDSGDVTVPACSTYNYGSVPAASYTVWMRIGTLYAATATVSSHAVGLPRYVTFPAWTAHERGNLTVTCTTDFIYDHGPTNNERTGSVGVRLHDAGVVGITVPTDSILPGSIVPRCSLRNFGTDRDPNVSVKFFINTVPPYSQTINLPAGLPLGRDTVVRFPAWTAAIGNYVARCSTGQALDVTFVNDTLSRTFQVLPPPSDTGWMRRTDLPIGYKNKYAKDGAGLAFEQVNDTDYVYALKGNNRLEFYRYTIARNLWDNLESLPAIGSAGKKKMVKKGGAMTALDDRVYAVKGNSTVEFWTYSPGATDFAYPWREAANVPMGARTLKEGSSLYGYDGNIYLLKGSNTTEFWRHNVATNSWEALSGAPLGTSGKAFRNGSALTGDGSGVLYALKGSYNELFAYSISNNTWVTKATLPFIGAGGRKKKVKDGAAIAYHNGRIYALKGGNTNEFWSWRDDSWRQLPDMPFGTGKKVKGGGSMTCAGELRSLFALKGNGTLEFYRYGLAADEVQAAGFKPQAMAQAQAPGASCALRITPSLASFRNPQSAIRIDYSLPRAGHVSLKLFDISGKLVTTLAEGHRPAGASSFTVLRSTLACGVFIFKLEAGASKATAKLVIE